MFRSIPRPKLPELLSPAGSPQALEAAVYAGADAVYLGAGSFNARMNAHNFDKVALADAVALAHAYGVRVYLTLNTQVYDRELSDALSTAFDAAETGVDGLIVADVGLSKQIHAHMPTLPLHASTQLSCHQRYAGDALSSMGFSRFVMAREATLEDLRTSVQESGLEVEVFVHGALCVSHSGQCLFSSLVGGRSGNRGLCAQPCRLPYRGVHDKVRLVKGDMYPLSLKDLSLATHIPELIDCGVASLKIEGRMKSPAYVGGVTAIYRRLLDEERAATREEMQMLAHLFSREGFTDGYFKNNITAHMLGVRTEADKANTSDAEQPISAKEGGHLPLDMEISVKANCPVTLTMTSPVYRQGDDMQVTCCVTSDTPQAALNRPIDQEGISKQLSRLGGTPYHMGQLTCHIDGGLMFPLSQLNALRRECVARIDEEREQICREQVAWRCHKEELSLPVEFSKQASHQVIYTARFTEAGQIPLEAHEFFDIMYLPLENWVKPLPGQKPYGVILPPVIFDREVDMVRRRLLSVISDGAIHLLVGNIAHIAMVHQILIELPQETCQKMVLHGDFRLNVCNTKSADAYVSMGLADVLLSPELTLPRMRDIIDGANINCGAVIYGRMPLMLLEKCAIRAIYPDGGVSAPCGKAGEACNICRQNKAVMVDRRGVKFPILRTYPHRNVVYNSRPLSMTDRGEVLDHAGLSRRHMIFSVETSAEVARVIDATQKGLPLLGDVSRMGK